MRESIVVLFALELVACAPAMQTPPQDAVWRYLISATPSRDKDVAAAVLKREVVDKGIRISAAVEAGGKTHPKGHAPPGQRLSYTPLTSF